MKLLLVSAVMVTLCSLSYAGELPSQSRSAEPSSQTKRALVKKVLALGVGDSYQTVTNQLGVPTFNTRHQNKNGSFFGRTLKYSFHSQGADPLEGPFPESVVVYFDAQDRLRYVTLKTTIGDQHDSEPGGPANRGQPVGSDTNRTSEAAGPRG